MNNNDFILDMIGKKIEFGHIVAVRYVWNSYVGVSRLRGLCAESKSIEKAFFSPQAYSAKATYQILGHVDELHPDFNEEVFDWYNSDVFECPIKITVYENANF